MTQEIRKQINLEIQENDISHIYLTENFIPIILVLLWNLRFEVKGFQKHTTTPQKF